MGRIAEEEREKVQVRLDKIEQIFCINSGDFIPKSRNYECTNGGAVALANIFCWAAALLYAQMGAKSVVISPPSLINTVHSQTSLSACLISNCFVFNH